VDAHRLADDDLVDARKVEDPHHGARDLTEERGLDELVEHWLASYDLLVEVPIVAGPAPDGIRAPDPAFQRAVADRLRAELAARHLPLLRLDPDDRAGWLDAVEAVVAPRLAGTQLSLLD